MDLLAVAGALVGIAAFLATVFVALSIEDRIVERVHRVHRVVWDAAGRPMGGWRVPEGSERSSASRARGVRAMNAWESATAGPIAEDAELVKLLLRRRASRRWAYVFWSIGFACIIAANLF
jgi:hypothetical protein